MIQSLLRNEQIAETQVFAFCDGPRNTAEEELVKATRDVLRTSRIPNLELIERPHNFGLANSVIEGVTTLCASHGRAIVLEDDLVLSSTFLAYMNAALERYRHEGRVLHVSGYMYPTKFKTKTEQEAVLLPFVNPWGWATWDRAWKLFDPAARYAATLGANADLRHRFDLNSSFFFYRILTDYLQGRVDSWFIRWYLSVFAVEGLGVFPVKSLVANTGFGDDATHTKTGHYAYLSAAAHDRVVERFPEPLRNEEAYTQVCRFLRWDMSIPVRGVRKLLRLMRLHGNCAANE